MTRGKTGMVIAMPHAWMHAVAAHAAASDELAPLGTMS